MSKINKLERERIKLNRLALEASEYNIDLTSKALLKQSRKLDKLIIDSMISSSSEEEKTA